MRDSVAKLFACPNLDARQHWAPSLYVDVTISVADL